MALLAADLYNKGNSHQEPVPKPLSFGQRITSFFSGKGSDPNHHPQSHQGQTNEHEGHQQHEGHNQNNPHSQHDQSQHHAGGGLFGFFSGRKQVEPPHHQQHPPTPPHSDNPPQSEYPPQSSYYGYGEKETGPPGNYYNQ